MIKGSLQNYKANNRHISIDPQAGRSNQNESRVLDRMVQILEQQKRTHRPIPANHNKDYLTRYDVISAEFQQLRRSIEEPPGLTGRLDYAKLKAQIDNFALVRVLPEKTAAWIMKDRMVKIPEIYSIL
jgi:hypothetical protein